MKPGMDKDMEGMHGELEKAKIETEEVLGAAERLEKQMQSILEK